MHEAKMMKQQGKKIWQIAEALGKSERTVHYYLSEPTRRRKKREYTSKLDPFKPYIDTILEDDPAFNREVLLRNLRKQNYCGGISILREYAARKTAEITRKAVIRFETEPGYQGQVDWKLLGTQLVDGRQQKLYAFTMVLGYSRAPFVIHTTSMDQGTFLTCHVLAFQYFGGVPTELLYDNMKTAFVYCRQEEKWKVNKHLLALASHYGFTPRRCRVRRPETKGKVERFIHFYENNFWIEQKARPVNLEELNEAVLAWIENISGTPIGGVGESRSVRFAQEKNYLTPLSQQPFDCRRPQQVKVSREALVRVRANWYSVPPLYIGRELTLRIDPLSLQAELSDGGKVVRSFQLDLEQKNRRYYLPEHRRALRELWRRQFEPKRRKRKLPSAAEVSVRSPDQYERLFELQEAAS